MILGRIKIQVESIGPKYLFCRPLIAGNHRDFPGRPGVCHVVYVERSLLTQDVRTRYEYWFFGIFDKAPNNDQFQNGYMNSKVTPISEEIYEALKLIYPQNNHCFAVD